MLITIKDILLANENCVLEDFEPSSKDIYLNNIPASAPEDLARLFSEIKRVKIFSDPNRIPANSNSWDLMPGFFTDCPTITADFGPTAPEDEYMTEYYDKFYLLGTSASDGGHIIGISLHPESVGMIFDYYVDSFGAPVGMRKIANTFTEWIERTLAAGPDGEIYWFSPNFIDLGPAIPNDPYYEPKN